MGRWPTYADNQLLGVVTGSQGSVSIAPPGSTHTKGGWAQIIASTAFPAAGFIFQDMPSLGATATALVDIGIGAEGQEQTIVSNFLSCRTHGRAYINMQPIYIPVAKGSRISIRYQQSTISYGHIFRMIMLPAGFSPVHSYQLCTTYGAVTADSGGTHIDPGASANTWGAWTQITAATTRAARAIMFEIGNANDTSKGANLDWVVALGMGDAGSETIILDNLGFGWHTSTADMFPHTFGPYPVMIPAGTRLAARGYCTVSTAGDRLFDIVVHTLL